MRVLLSGFEPFGGDAENASGAVVAALAESWSDRQVDLVTVVLPVRFDAGPALLASAIARLEPDVVLCLGEAGGRGEITPERWAGPLPRPESRTMPASNPTPSHSTTTPGGSPPGWTPTPWRRRSAPSGFRRLRRKMPGPSCATLSSGQPSGTSTVRPASSTSRPCGGEAHLPGWGRRLTRVAMASTSRSPSTTSPRASGLRSAPVERRGNETFRNMADLLGTVTKSC